MIRTLCWPRAQAGRRSSARERLDRGIAYKLHRSPVVHQECEASAHGDSGGFGLTRVELYPSPNVGTPLPDRSADTFVSKGRGQSQLACSGNRESPRSAFAQRERSNVWRPGLVGFVPRKLRPVQGPQEGIFDLEGDFVFASYLVRLRADESKIIPEYLNFYLNSDLGQRRLLAYATPGVSQTNISAGNLRRVFVPVPSLEEQKEIVRILNEVESSKFLLKQHIHNTRNSLVSLMNSLIVRSEDYKVAHV